MYLCPLPLSTKPPVFILLFLSSGYFNGARFFQCDRTDQRNAAGGMFIIMGFLWLVEVPLLIVAIVMVCYVCTHIIEHVACAKEFTYSRNVHVF